MSRLTLTNCPTYHRSPKFTSAPLTEAKVNLSDENVDFLPLDEVHELKRIVDDGNLEVRRLQYSYNLDADDSETASLELARREATRGKWDEETISPYYRQRHYDPNPAQFVSEDPLGFDGGDKNLYGYVGNSPVNYTDPTGLIAEGFLDTLGNKLEGAAYEIAGFIVRNVHEPVGRSLADNYALESALRTGDSIAVGVAQTGNFVGFDIRPLREDLYGEEVNDNLNETIVTISTTGTLVLGGFALSGLAAGSAAFNATATAAINVGLINAGFGLTTQLIFNEGNSSNLDYGSLALDFGFGTLGSFVGAGVAAKTGGGLVSRIGFSTAFEGAFAGTEQVVRNLANGGSWSQDVRSAILSSIIFQGGSEVLSNGREILLAGGRLLRAGDNLADDLLGAFGGRRLALEGVGEVPNLQKGGNKFAASTGETSPGDIPGRTNNVNGNVSPGSIRLDEDFGSINPIPQGVGREVEFDEAFDLVKAALDFRRLNKTPKNRNIAVFEFLNRKTGKLEIEAFENIPQVRKGRKIIRHGMHAEQVGAAKLRERHIRFKDVTRIFSEFEPCIGGTNDCANLIKRTFPNTQVFFAFPFNNGFNDLTRPRKISALNRFGALFD